MLKTASSACLSSVQQTPIDTNSLLDDVVRVRERLPKSAPLAPVYDIHRLAGNEPSDIFGSGSH